MTVSASLRKRVIARAGGCCEYCLMPQAASRIPFHIDHIIPKKHGGSDDTDNLCHACFVCNGRKGTDFATFDPASGKLTEFYHPRKQSWDNHFAIQPDFAIIGKTPEGRATVHLLQMNTKRRMDGRKVLSMEGKYPCQIPAP